MKKTLLAAVLSGSMTFAVAPASAQDFTPVFDAEAVFLQCQLAPETCEDLIAALLIQLDMLQLSDEFYQANVALLVDAVVRVSNSSTNPATNALLSGALNRIAASPRLDDATKTALTTVSSQVAAGIKNLAAPAVRVKPKPVSGS